MFFQHAVSPLWAVGRSKYYEADGVRWWFGRTGGCWCILPHCKEHKEPALMTTFFEVDLLGPRLGFDLY